MRKWRSFSIIILFIFVRNAYASPNDFDNYFQQGLQAANAHKQQAQNAFNQFNPKNTFDQYTANPQESHYYEGVKQEKTHIKEEALAHSEESDVAKDIEKAH